VTENPFHARTGADGRFEIRGVPPGRWTLRIWHEELGDRTVEIDVRPDAFDAGPIVLR
jgi:hypothetical protein